jgi:gamma-glutamylcyclotransferase (GGCT)/AIG2-like uncharacterized protein YtfP
MTDPSPILAVYGTLRRGEGNEALLAGATYLGTGRIDGRLFEMAASHERAYSYPALILGTAGHVVVELYGLAGAAMLAAVDALEAYDPTDEAGSEYVRCRAAVRHGPVDEAWVYVYNGPPSAMGERIDHGDWVAHRRALDATAAVDPSEPATD